MIAWVLLALCVLLSYWTALQRREIAALRQSVRELRERTEEDVRRLEARLGAVRDEGRLVRAVQVRAVGAVPERRRLKAEVRLSLREWREDTRVCLLTDGPDCRQVPLDGGGGTYSAQVELPLDVEPLSFRVRVDSGGLVREEVLQNAFAASGLLPVQYRTGSWSADWDRGTLTVYACAAALQGPGEDAADLTDPAFRVSVNGGTALTEAARQAENGEWQKQNQPWLIACQRDDEVRLTFTCKDRFGLSYAFLVDGWNLG